jgi:hypothetical protein
VCRRVCGVLHGAYSARTTHRASIWSLSSFAIEACPPFHRPSHCLLRHSKLPVSLLLKHHSRSLQMRVSSVNSALPPVCIHVSHFITQTPPPLHAHHCRPPYISSSPMLFLFFVSRTASLLANRPSNKLIAAGLLVYIYIFSNTSVSSIFIIVHKLETASRTMQRRVTCSFLEPIPELRRSDSGKPYVPPRTKSPAPVDMVNRVNSLRGPTTSRTSSMPVRSSSFSRRAMAIFKRVNSAAVCKNLRAEVDIGEAQKWQREMEGLEN